MKPALWAVLAIVAALAAVNEGAAIEGAPGLLPLNPPTTAGGDETILAEVFQNGPGAPPALPAPVPAPPPALAPDDFPPQPICPEYLGVPAWHVEVDALLLWRDNAAGRRTLAVDSDLQTPLAATDDFDFGLRAGPRLTLGHWLDECWGWELVYFGTQHWTDRATLAGDDRLSLPGDLGAETSDFNRADRMDFAWSSELHNAEINEVWRFGRIEWLAGFRYLRWAEDFGVRAFDSDTGASDYRIAAANDLYGVQAGVRTGGQWNRLGWEAGAKLGLFGNSARQRTFLGDLDNSVVLRDLRTSGGSLAMASELNLGATYEISD